MAKIQLLSKQCVDQIAAGEVVEHPANVVKELVENSIDAGANAITVEIKDGGISFIRVTDDGCGIEKDQIHNAFLRHATSKILSVDDLEHIHSLGFRGEALASISAVSELEIITKTANDMTGILLNMSGDQEINVDEVGVPQGTTMIVRNLFFNVPVRKKFLKSAHSEANAISELMEHLALSHPDISFNYINNKKTIFYTSGNNDSKDVIYKLFGRDITKELLPFHTSFEGIEIAGYIGKPTINRASRSFELYFVNGRYVKSDVVASAIEEGYRTYVMQHKFPFVVLYIQVDPSNVDVNVHPTKMDVRFTYPDLIYENLSKAIRETLQQSEHIVKVSLVEEKTECPESKAINPEPFEKARSIQLDAVQLYVENDKKPALKVEEDPFFIDFDEPSTEKDLSDSVPQYENSPSIAPKISPTISVVTNQIVEEKMAQMELFEDRFLDKKSIPDYEILGQIFDTYWIIAFHDKMFIIDQHAAHEKVNYERFMAHYRNKEVSSQNLNPPIILSLAAKEAATLNDYLAYFTDMGFEIDPFGGNEYAIRAVPLDLYGCGEKEFFIALLDELMELPMRKEAEVITHKIASMACKASVKGNMKMSRIEIAELIDLLLQVEDPYHCPHGRPTIIEMSKYEIEKKFKRIL